ncbi:MAG: hypothetical protein H6686_12005 [Fibrobacteria bacterium]|nr:hypothetical protein [Fibrobacteria bacterium]
MIRKVSRGRRGHRMGVVLGLVVMIGVIVLIVGVAMVTQTQGLLLGSVDSKQRIKARIAAETQATLQIASAMEKAALLYGNEMTLPSTPLAALPTEDGLKGESSVEQTGMTGGQLAQEPITSGPFKGFTGLKLSYLVHATGYAPGGAKSKVDVEMRIYQIPIFQFGVFYQGNLEITPGPSMNVMGPVHTNGSAFFRSPTTGADLALEFQGPITATGSIYQWASAGSIKYRVLPIDPSVLFQPSLASSITPLTDATSPPELDGWRNIQWGVDSLKLPIETSDPRQILMPGSPSDPAGMSRQKFANKASSASRWINPGNGSGRPSWITGSWANTHRVFWDRREQAWVRYWNFDVAALIASGNRDSVFYIADTFDHGADHGLAHKQTITAFRIINASRLPRNMTIATPNPVYIMGDFNTQPTPGCYDRSLGSPPPSGDYCNALIASDAITLLSPKWLNYKRGNSFGCDERQGNLDQGAENALWTMDAASPEKMNGAPNDTALARSDTCGAFQGTVTVNAALMTGNKAAPPWVLPPNNYSNWTFETGYEGGWHNTIRFLEDLSWSTVNFKGSFVCMWEARSRGLKTTGKVIQTLPGGYYSAPTRNWGFDPRFSNLSNMPPATPFLATQPITTWSELR